MNKAFQYEILRVFLLAWFVCFFVGINAQKVQFPYSLNKKDIIFITLGTGVKLYNNSISDNTSYISPEEALSLNNSSINSFDRIATHRWSPLANDASDITNLLLSYGPLLIAIPKIKNKEWKNILTLGVMFLETRGLNKEITGLIKHKAGRIRPYMYNAAKSNEFKLDMSKEANTYKSFLSGHTSEAFSMAVFCAKTFTDMYGKSKWSKLIWVGSLSIASTTACLRVAAGKHYPTDVLAGAAFGSAIGYLVPYLHLSKSEKVSFIPSANGFYLSYRF